MEGWVKRKKGEGRGLGDVEKREYSHMEKEEANVDRG